MRQALSTGALGGREISADDVLKEIIGTLWILLICCVIAKTEKLNKLLNKFI